MSRVSLIVLAFACVFLAHPCFARNVPNDNDGQTTLLDAAAPAPAIAATAAGIDDKKTFIYGGVGGFAGIGGIGGVGLLPTFGGIGKVGGIGAGIGVLGHPAIGAGIAGAAGHGLVHP